MVEEEELKIEAPEEERRFFVPVDKVEVEERRLEELSEEEAIFVIYSQ